MHVAGAAEGGNGGFCFGGIEVFGLLFEGGDLARGGGVVFYVDGIEEDVGFTDELEDLALFGAGKGVDGRHELAHDVGLGEALGGGFEFIAFDEKEECFDAFIDVTNGFVGERVEGGNDTAKTIAVVKVIEVVNIPKLACELDARLWRLTEERCSYVANSISG
ncbi:hypothetical protein N9Z02_01785 [Akkermansiaceae bacterium]|nr:hypothetical protein [Akkermansiaceae bacterium]